MPHRAAAEPEGGRRGAQVGPTPPGRDVSDTLCPGVTSSHLSVSFCLLLRAASRLCSMAALVPTLQVMAAVHDVSPLLRYLLPPLVQSVFISSSGEACSMYV